jgi:hypothetical protein
MDLTPQRAADRRPTPADPRRASLWPFAQALSDRDANSVTLCSGVHHGSPAVLISTPSHVVFVSMHGGVARRVMSLGIRHVFLVDESATSTGGPLAEVTVLAVRATITLTRVDRQRAVDFCNAVRLAILTEGTRRGSPRGSRSGAPSRAAARPHRRSGASATR